MRSNKLMHFARERIGAQPQVICVEAIFVAQLVAALARRKVGATESNQTDLGLAGLHNFRPRNERPRSLKFLREPLHIVEVVVGPLGVLRPLIMAGAASEVRSLRMIGTRERAIAHAIVVDILITSEPAKPCQILGAQYFAAIQRLVGI